MTKIKEYAGIISFLALIIVSLTTYSYSRDIKGLDDAIKEESNLRKAEDTDIKARIKSNEDEHDNFITQKEADVIKELINRNYDATIELNKDIKELIKN